MWIDIAFALFVTILVVWGWMSGILKQAVRLVVLVGCILVAPTVGELLGPFLMSWLDLGSLDAARLIGRIAGGALLYVVLLTLTTVAIRLLHDGSDLIEVTDRGAGAALGAAKGLVVVLLVSFALLSAQREGLDDEDGLSRSIDESLTLSILSPIMSDGAPRLDDPASSPEDPPARPLDSDATPE